mmetsp:Transcript_183735/g.447351  ORF Transcript_183735/g.447351 Transcript_183735/m.447351 type:complete len:324 (-) Transcript_183735:100-1071(-)
MLVETLGIHVEVQELLREGGEEPEKRRQVERRRVLHDRQGDAVDGLAQHDDHEQTHTLHVVLQVQRRRPRQVNREQALPLEDDEHQVQRHHHREADDPNPAVLRLDEAASPNDGAGDQECHLEEVELGPAAVLLDVHRDGDVRHRQHGNEDGERVAVDGTRRPCQSAADVDSEHHDAELHAAQPALVEEIIIEEPSRVLCGQHPQRVDAHEHRDVVSERDGHQVVVAAQVLAQARDGRDVDEIEEELSPGNMALVAQFLIALRCGELVGALPVHHEAGFVTETPGTHPLELVPGVAMPVGMAFRLLLLRRGDRRRRLVHRGAL